MSKIREKEKIIYEVGLNDTYYADKSEESSEEKYDYSKFYKIAMPDSKEEIKDIIDKIDAKLKNCLRELELTNLADLEKKIIELDIEIKRLDKENKDLKKINKLREQKQLIEQRNHFERKFEFMEAQNKLTKEQEFDEKRKKEEKLFFLIDKNELNIVDENENIKNSTLKSEDVHKVIKTINYTESYLIEVKKHKRTNKIEFFTEELKELQEIRKLADDLKIIKDYPKWTENFHKELRKKFGIEVSALIKTINDKKSEVEIHKKNNKLVLAKEICFVVDELEEFRAQAEYLNLFGGVKVPDKTKNEPKEKEPIETEPEIREFESSVDFFSQLKNELNLESISSLREKIKSIKSDIAKEKLTKKISKLKLELDDLLSFDNAAVRCNFKDEEIEGDFDLNAILDEHGLAEVTEFQDYLDYLKDENEKAKNDEKAYKQGNEKIKEVEKMISLLIEKGLLPNLNEKIKALKEKMNEDGITSYRDLLEAIKCSEEEGLKVDLDRFIGYKKEIEALGVRNFS